MNRNMQQLIDAYAEAVQRKDAEVFLSLYAADVKVFDTWGRWIYEDRDAWATMPAAWFADLVDETVRVEAETLSCFEWANAVVWVGNFVFIGMNPDGDEMNRITNRWTWVAEQRPEGWKIVHEHSSLPVDMPSMRALPRED